MELYIHKGSEGLGGNIIEISTKTTKIILDVGGEEKDLPMVKDIFNKNDYKGIFITHYHDDHAALVPKIHKNIPVFIGETAYNIFKSSYSYKFKKCFKPAGFFKHKQPILVGDIKVTPYLCDHSACDSYMLYCEAQGESILYTGDFRAHGRGDFEKLLHELPKNPDRLICEGTAFSKGNYNPITENELEARAIRLFEQTKGPVFALQMPLNIDRVLSFYNAAQNSSRMFLQDTYGTVITNAAKAAVESYTFIASPIRIFSYFRNKRRISKKDICNSSFVMCVRPSMKGYVKKLSKRISFENGILVYSCQSALKNKKSMQSFLNECEKLGLRVITLHTGGHADVATLKRFIKTLNPKKLIPIHTEHPEKFKNILPEFFD